MKICGHRTERARFLALFFFASETHETHIDFELSE